MLPLTINVKGRLIEFDRPLVMGIINLTADSFYAGSRADVALSAERAWQLSESGADILDIGACSTRPGGEAADELKETDTILRAIEKIRHELPEAVISVDTFRASVARKSIEAGADIINDVSGGSDPDMFPAVAEMKVPYVLTHSRGDSRTMQNLTDYEDVSADVLRDIAFKTDKLRQMGVSDVIVDPGFGFAKTLDQNYRLLADLDVFHSTGCPVLAGLSRKSMIYKELGKSQEDSLNGTTALNMIALLNGADILRVHDVIQAAETIRLYEAYRRNLPARHTIITKEKGGKVSFEEI